MYCYVMFFTLLKPAVPAPEAPLSFTMQRYLFVVNNRAGLSDVNRIIRVNKT